VSGQTFCTDVWISVARFALFDIALVTAATAVLAIAIVADITCSNVSVNGRVVTFLAVGLTAFSASVYIF
jgi:hypothetical protein